MGGVAAAAACVERLRWANLSGVEEPNGLVLPSTWPPRSKERWWEFAARHEPFLRKNESSRPRASTVLVDVGRQLFVDDFVVEPGRFARRWFRAKWAATAVLWPDRDFETGWRGAKTARPFGGGATVDRGGRVILWYRCGWRGRSGKTCAAVSGDGLAFRKVGVVLETRHVEAFEVAYDLAARQHVALRMEFMTRGTRYGPYASYVSKDGLSWRRRDVLPLPKGYPLADRSTFFLNPLRRAPVWIFSLRENLCLGGPSGHMRVRRYAELSSSSSSRGRRLAPYLRSYFQCRGVEAPNEPVPWLGVDKADCPVSVCDLYAVDGIAYESLLLHGIAVLRGPNAFGELKNNSVHIGFSRDGFHVDRAPGPFLPPFHGASNFQLASGSPIVRGDKLLFYAGYATDASTTIPVHANFTEKTGLAVLRRDGFVALEPLKTKLAATVTTRPLAFAKPKHYLFLNLRLADDASLKVDFLDDAAAPLCDRSTVLIIKGPLDSTKFLVPNIPANFAERFTRRRFRLRFKLLRQQPSSIARLYAFWFSEGPHGRSAGYLGGGELLTGLRVDDTTDNN